MLQCYWNFDYEYQIRIKSKKWEDIFNHCTPTNIYDTFNNEFFETLNKHCPVQEIKIKNQPDNILWEDENCKQQKNKVDLYHDFSRDDPTNNDRKNWYLNEKQNLLELLRKAKEKYNTNRIMNAECK